jgi:hypothetical protein
MLLRAQSYTEAKLKCTNRSDIYIDTGYLNCVTRSDPVGNCTAVEANHLICSGFSEVLRTCHLHRHNLS